jgi:RimJ/RimL family protein N-acetyltransferase
LLFIAKQKYQLKKIYAGFYSNNIGSEKVLKKNGFKKEAHFKNQLIYKNKRIDFIKINE